MRTLDLSYPEPERNLALDEALLNVAEASHGAETLRFWESPIYFAVLGVAQVTTEVLNVEACRNDEIPILRRCSAGGCVMQGPGCLNFSLILDQQSRPEVNSIRGSYCYILGKVRDALNERTADSSLEGISDLAIDGLKVSGNAQRRRKRFILHHGTLLYRFDMERMSPYLLEPEDRPEYRGRREHDKFATNLPLSEAELRQIVSKTFNGETTSNPISTTEEIESARLAESKYVNSEWNFRR